MIIFTNGVGQVSAPDEAALARRGIRVDRRPIADLVGDRGAMTGENGRTSVPGLYAAGDSTPPGPEQLLVAAGTGAHTAAAINRDLIGALHAPTPPG